LYSNSTILVVTWYMSLKEYWGANQC